MFLCISVTGTGTDGGERVGRGFDIRRYPLSMYFRTGVVYAFVLFSLGIPRSLLVNLFKVFQFRF